MAHPLHQAVLSSLPSVVCFKAVDKADVGLEEERGTWGRASCPLGPGEPREEGRD